MTALSTVGLEVALPLGGFVLLALLGKRLPRRLVTTIGVGSVAAAALVAAMVAGSFMVAPPPSHRFVEIVWRWMSAGGFEANVGFTVDALSVVMTLVVSWVGLLIHIYSAEFMENDDSYSRYFAYMNLFVGAMLVLVLADNLLLLYLGWEGVGLCSYLLIGFWYRDPANGRAARKAFIVTRVGDASLAVALMLLVTHFGTLEIQDLMARAPAAWAVGATPAVVVAFLLLGGAVGKSAQLPLQTWLPDAMAGPTPVSALIHAATMVTAGVYLIARTHALFLLAPAALFAVAVIGAVTLLVAGLSALVQYDIKRVLAYSTISQIGYMFLGLGVGAWAAAIFHLIVHAFFKSLLFLGAGVVIEALGDEHDIRKMGGLGRQLPVTYWSFVAACGALAGFPFVTAGFYSKDAIIAQSWLSQYGGVGLWAAGIAGVVITGLYAFRLLFLVFLGKDGPEVTKRPRAPIRVPLAVLGALSIVSGVLGVPAWLGGFQPLLDFLAPVLPSATGMPAVKAGLEAWLGAASAAASLLGILAAYGLFVVRRRRTPAAHDVPVSSALRRWWYEDWGFDRLYGFLFVRPYLWVARVNRNDFIDSIYDGLVSGVRGAYAFATRTQTGLVRWYAAGIAAGAVLIVALVIFL